MKKSIKISLIVFHIYLSLVWYSGIDLSERSLENAGVVAVGIIIAVFAKLAAELE